MSILYHVSINSNKRNFKFFFGLRTDVRRFVFRADAQGYGAAAVSGPLERKKAEFTEPE